MEHWERLKTLEFCWSDELFRPGLDSFLLGSLPRLRPGLRVCDLGCGTGLLSLLLLQREARLDVTGVEILPEAVSLAEKTVERNRLGDRLRFIQGDLRDALPAGGFDLAVCNPPYYPVRRRFPAERAVGGQLHPAGGLPGGGTAGALGRALLPGP